MVDAHPNGNALKEGVWPLKIWRRATLMTLKKQDDGSYRWTCRECGTVMHTSIYERPEHNECVALTETTA